MVKDVKMLKAPIVLIASLNISNLEWALDGQLFSARVTSKALFLWLMWSKLSENYPVAFEAKPWFSFCFPVKMKTQPEQKKSVFVQKLSFPSPPSWSGLIFSTGLICRLVWVLLTPTRWDAQDEFECPNARKFENDDQRKSSYTKMMGLLLIKEVWADILTLMFSQPGLGFIGAQ